MKKNIFFIIVYALTLIISAVNVAITIKDNLFFDINSLPQGNYSYSVASPTGDKVLNIYVVENSLGAAVRGEIVSGGVAKNVFWQTDTAAVASYWENNDVVNVNELSINIAQGAVYDCRRGTSLFQEGNLGGLAAPEIINNLQENQ
ncbi:MAG: hypothetical protein IJZ75_00610 [Clostridia bacterium]|nr:hypothetical protein [Clostridia bacterium]